MKLNSTQKQLLVDIANIKKTTASSQSAQALADELHIGRKQGNHTIIYSTADAEIAKHWCERYGIDTNSYQPKQSSRSTKAKQEFKEKGAGVFVYKTFVPHKSIGDVFINGALLSMPSEGFHLLRPEDVKQIKAEGILVIENLDTFLVNATFFAPLVPKNTMIVYRGSPQFGGNNEGAIAKWRTNFQIPVIGFYDYDLSGLIKMMEWPWDSFILPKTDSIKKSGLKANFEDLKQQKNELVIKFPNGTPGWMQKYYDFFQDLDGSFTQERLISHDIEFECIERQEVIVND